MKGLNYFSLTGEYLSQALNRQTNFKMPIDLRHIIMAVTNNNLYEVSFSGKNKIMFDPADGKFKTIESFGISSIG
jgi:hypothetical protein